MAYSLPGEDPKTTLKLEEAAECCEAKGHGWHLSTNAEWAAIALWCKKNGFLPYGNNDYGKDSRESVHKAVSTTYNDAGRTVRVATGTGPVTWSHDKTMSGIWDMNGNVGEWQGGLRIVWGEVQILANNDAADPDNPQNATSTCWRAINAADGTLVEPECKTTDTAGKTSGSTVKLDFVSNAWKYSTNITNAVTEGYTCNFGAVTCDGSIGDAAKVILRALALLPDLVVDASVYEDDTFYCINGEAERCIYRGGISVSAAASGIFNLSGGNSRSAALSTLGFRAAYIPEI
ncbi:MAG: SUMF1/EgtB/PvdO family nonheme iron enzyme [Paludibacteraceae bacterium]|nr:SUMF1/EgtB/PvdO family nonheme iron enzyme [Paludibacteraceae bacterium]